MTFDHSGRVALVTGAGSGIGRATAERLASEGTSIAVVDLRLDAAEETVATIAAAGGRAVASAADVRDGSQVRRARDEALAAFGVIHYLVNSAGLVRMTALDDLDEEEWDLVVDTNLKGMFLVTQAVAPAIGDGGGGAIVNMSTIESEVVVSSQGHPQVHYNASKGGVKMLTKALAVELADRSIRVNAVAPGPSPPRSSRAATSAPRKRGRSCPSDYWSRASASPRTSPRRSRSCCPTTRRSSREHSCPWTAGGSLDDARL